MKCPNCEKDIYSVQVSSRCHQIGYLDDDPNNHQILNYSSPDVDGSATNIYCLECGADITSAVKL